MPQNRLLVFAVGVIASLFFSKVYRLWPGGSLAAMVGRVTLGWLLCWTAVMVLLVLTKTGELFSRTWLVTWLLVTIGTLWVARLVSFLVMAQMRRAGYMHKKVLLVGSTSMTSTVRHRVENATWSGFDIVASVDSHDSAAIARLDGELKPDEIWIGMRMADHQQLDEVMLVLRQSVANVRVLPDLQMYQILNHGMSVTLGIPMVDVSVTPMFGERRLAKAALDLAAAGLILVLISPLMLVIAAAVKLTSKGPVLFKQKRHGWNGEEIWVYKFRSMVVHQEKTAVVTQATREDPRVTPVGRFLRKSSLDELPQFINVLQGQICGYRGETDTLDKMEGRIKHDLYYLEHWSVWMDIKIIFLTPMATIQNKNAY
jgi:putative colanic acid biosynthesis UDP-glucose lipid carrier transferase